MKFSVITINYNNSNGLLRTIQSVVEQSYPDIEYIIIDGGSNDDSIQYIKQFSSKIDYWVSEPDRGIYHAMNKGIAASSGEYCLFLNSGDILNNKHVLFNVAKECSGEDFIIGRVRYINTGQLSEYPLNFTMKLFFEKSIPHPATFIKRTIFEELLYDESLKIVSDWKLFIETIIMRNASCKNVNEVVADFDSTGISSINKSLVEDERLRVLTSILPPRVYEDYVSLVSGEGYKLSYYDRFYIKLRDYQYGKWIYTLSVFLMRIVALVRPGAVFVKNFPLFLPKNND